MALLAVAKILGGWSVRRVLAAYHLLNGRSIEALTVLFRRFNWHALSGQVETMQQAP